MLMTTFIFSYIIGNICDLVNNQNSAALEFQSWHDSMNKFFSEQDIPEELRKEARVYGRYLQEQGQFSDTTVLEKLSESLRRKILMKLYGGYLRQVRFFIGASNELLERLCEVLQFYTEAAEQFIFQQGHNADSMYVVVNGILKSSKMVNAKLKSEKPSLKQTLSRQRLNAFQTTASGKMVYCTYLEKGDVFGYEALVFKNKPRQMTVKSKTICQMFELSRSAFDKVM
jgi:CRP-like cAMP-binding protein